MHRGGIHSRNPGDGTAETPGTERKMSVTSESSIQILTSKQHDAARQARGLETAEEAIQADYPMVDTSRHRLRHSAIILWAVPFFGFFALKYGKVGFMRVFYVDDYPKASLGILALSSVLAVLVDAFSDPVMANVTDNFNPGRLNQLLYGSTAQKRSIGRRAAFVLAGGGMMWVTVILGFVPLVPAGVAASVWYGVFHIAYQLADTMLLIAHNAWAVDMTPSNTDREKLWALRELVNSVGIVVGTLVTGRLRTLGGLDCTDDPSDGCLGLPVSGAIFGGLMIACLVIWLCAAKERPTERLPPSPPTSKWSAEGVVPMLVTAFIHRPFFFLVACEVTEAIGLDGVLPFYARAVLGAKCMNPVDTTINATTIYLVCRLLSLPFWRMFGNYVGPYYGHLTCSIARAVICLPFVIPGRDDESCTQTYILYAACVGWGLATGGNYIRRLVVGNCVDYDTFITGKNREAQYPTILNFAPRLADATTEGVPLLLLAYFGYVRRTEDNKDPEQPWAVSAVCVACMSVVPFTFNLLGVVVLLGFPKAARPKSAHKALQNAIKNKHPLGMEAVDPWCPTRSLPPPPLPGPHHGILSYFFPFELRRAATGSAAGVVGAPAYGALMLAPAASICLALILAIPGVYFFIIGLDDLGVGLGASISVPATAVLGISLMLSWFDGSRLIAAIEVKRLSVPVAEIVQQYNSTCRFTARTPLTPSGADIVSTIGAPVETCGATS